MTLLAEGGDANVCRIDGASPLWIASQMGHDHIVRVLLKNGARVDAVRCVSSTKQVLVFAKIQISFFSLSYLHCWLQDGATPLFKASHKGFSAVVHELLKYKPNLYLLPVIIV